MMVSILSVQCTITPNKGEAINNAANYFFYMPEGIARIVIPTIISLIVFGLGQLLIWYRDQKKIRNEVMNFRNIIYTWIKLTNDPINKLIISCRIFSENIINSPNIHPERFISNTILVEQINSFGIERYVHTFITNSTKPKKDNKNEEMTFNLISQINYLNYIKSDIQARYNEYKNDILNLMDDWNKSYIELTDILNEKIRIITDDSHKYFLFNQQVHQIIEHWDSVTNDKTNSAANTLTHLIEPLINITNRELGSNIHNEYAFELIKKLQEIKVIELRWKTLINGYSELFNEIAKSIEDSHTALLEAKKYFENKTKLVSFCSLRSK